MAKKNSRNWLDKLPLGLLRLSINAWAPNLGAGIKIKTMTADFRYIEVILKMHWYNKNYVGTHFGGSIFSLTDPYYMLMLIKNLGHDYIVWDKAASIEYKKPGRGKLTAIFTLNEADLTLIRTEAERQPKYIFDKTVEVKDEQGEVVAEVVKTLYVRKKPLVSA